MAAAGEQGEAGAGVLLRLRLAEQASADGDDRVSGQNKAAVVCDGARLKRRQPLGQLAGLLAAEGCFVDIGAGDAVGGDADLRQQREPSGTGRGQDDGRNYLKRNVMRPLLRS
jgi:hypothetical protein